MLIVIPWFCWDCCLFLGPPSANFTTSDSPTHSISRVRQGTLPHHGRRRSLSHDDRDLSGCTAEICGTDVERCFSCTSWIPSVHEGAAGTEALPPRPPPCKPAKEEVQLVCRSITYILKTHIMTCSISRHPLHHEITIFSGQQQVVEPLSTIFLASPGCKRLGNRGRVKPTNTWTAIWLQNLHHFPNSSQACLFWEPQFVAWKCQQWCGGMLRPFASICCGKVMGSSVLLQVMLLQVTVAMKAGEWRYERMLGYDRLRLLENISGCVSSAESVPWPNQCHDQTSVRAVYKHVHVCVWHTCGHGCSRLRSGREHCVVIAVEVRQGTLGMDGCSCGSWGPAGNTAQMIMNTGCGWSLLRSGSEHWT